MVTDRIDLTPQPPSHLSLPSPPLPTLSTSPYPLLQGEGKGRIFLFEREKEGYFYSEGGEYNLIIQFYTQ